MSNKSQSGQAIIELSFSIMVASILLSGLLLIAYLALAKIWTTYQIEQTLLCSQSLNQTPQACVDHLRQKIQSTLPWGRWSARLEYYGPKTQLKASLQLAKNQELKWNQSIELESATKKDFSQRPCLAGSRCLSRSSQGWP